MSIRFFLKKSVGVIAYASFLTSVWLFILAGWLLYMELAPVPVPLSGRLDMPVSWDIVLQAKVVTRDADNGLLDTKRYPVEVSDVE